MNRTDIINRLIIDNGYKDYLEIGVQKGENFQAVICENKTGVDPDPESVATIHSTSNQFFQQNKDFFDIIFIDGLHEFTQVTRDISNSLLQLSEGGSVVVHDCLPTSEAMQAVPRIQAEWTGDVWRSMVYWNRDDFLKIKIFDTDFGVGVIQFGESERVILDHTPTWEEFDKNKHKWFDIVDV